MLISRAFGANFKNEESCYQFLENLRWPEGTQCPKCQSKKLGKKKAKRPTWRCGRCKYVFSLTTATVFNRCHSLRKKLAVAYWALLSTASLKQLAVARQVGMSSGQANKDIRIWNKIIFEYKRCKRFIAFDNDINLKHQRKLLCASDAALLRFRHLIQAHVTSYPR